MGQTVAFSGGGRGVVGQMQQHEFNDDTLNVATEQNGLQIVSVATLDYDLFTLVYIL